MHAGNTLLEISAEIGYRNSVEQDQENRLNDQRDDTIVICRYLKVDVAAI